MSLSSKLPARNRPLFLYGTTPPREGSADEAGFAVGAERGDHTHRVASGKEPPRIGREVQRDPPRPIAAQVQIAVDAAVADGGDSHRG